MAELSPQSNENGAESPDTPTSCPKCLRMRTKMDFVTINKGRPSGRPAEWDENDLLGGTAHHYYCLRTMTIIGPDNDLVGPKLCTTGRTCYETSGF